MMYEKSLISALERLNEAAERMVAQRKNFRRAIQPRKFRFCNQIVWPSDLYKEPSWSFVRVGNEHYWIAITSNRHFIAKEIINKCNGLPWKIFLALRRIQAATAWCRAQAAGRA